MPLKNGRLTPQETVFAERYAKTGDARYAAEKAGYSPRSIAQRASDNANDPAIMAHVTRLRRSMLANASIEAIDVLIDGMRDEKAPRQARNTAAATVLKYAVADDGSAEAKDPHEMTADELATALARAKAHTATLASLAADRARPVLEAEPLEQPAAPDIFE